MALDRQTGVPRICSRSAVAAIFFSMFRNIASRRPRSRDFSKKTIWRFLGSISLPKFCNPTDCVFPGIGLQPTSLNGRFSRTRILIHLSACTNFGFRRDKFISATVVSAMAADVAGGPRRVKSGRRWPTQQPTLRTYSGGLRGDLDIPRSSGNDPGMDQISPLPARTQDE